MQDQKINRYWKEIINTMNDGLMVVSPDGTILMVNQAFEKIMGYRREELIGRSCAMLNCDTCATARSEGKGQWCDLFEQGAATRKPCLFMRKDGSYVHILKNAAILRDEAGQVLGAVETLTDISELDKRDEKIQHLSKLVDTAGDFHGMVGKSPRMQQVFELTQKAAQSEAPVIIYGESGTGKELVAHAIHALGRRREGPFITCNCAALNEALLESELFGHVKGAFTGAYTHRQGRFEAAHRGDIFLDEVGDIPPAIQVKLLRVLESKQFERVGDHRPISVDVRIITATHRDLESLVCRGQIPGRPVFPHQCHSHTPAAPAGTSGRPPPAGGAFPQPAAPAQRQGDLRAYPGSHEDFPGSPLARQCAGTQRRAGVCLCGGRKRSHRAWRTCPPSWVPRNPPRELRQRPKPSPMPMKKPP